MALCVNVVKISPLGPRFNLSHLERAELCFTDGF